MNVLRIPFQKIKIKNNIPDCKNIIFIQFSFNFFSVVVISNNKRFVIINLVCLNSKSLFSSKI